MSNFIIVEQDGGKRVGMVRVKRVKCFPMGEDTSGKMQFGRLGFLLLQVVVRDRRDGSLLTFKLNGSRGINSPTFSVHHPETWDHPLLTVGTGRNRRQIRDTLSAKERFPGAKESYDTAREFSERLRHLVGAGLAGEIIQLFAQGMADAMSTAV